MTVLVLALAVAANAAAPYQLPPPVADPPQTQVITPPPPAQDPPPAPKPVPPLTRAEIQMRHDNIGMMESVLARAVSNGARSFQINSQVTVGFASGLQPRARGFILDGYGLFFDVEIPDVEFGIEMSMQQFLARLQEQQPQPNSPARRASSAQLESAVDNDPNEPYRQAVIAACTSAMLDYSKNLDVQPNEWLTVALRGSEVPIGQSLGRDAHTRMLRIKGSDLADFMASRITKEEAIKRVEKREF